LEVIDAVRLIMKWKWANLRSGGVYADESVEVGLRGIKFQRYPEALGDLAGVRAEVVEAEDSFLNPNVDIIECQPPSL
jgi:hypothetical protein